MDMASSEVEMSSCQTFNCVLNPHKTCLEGGDKNKINNVRNRHEKNLNVFVRDNLENESSVSECSLGSDPDPSFTNPGQPEKNLSCSSRKETMAASSLVQIWEARTTHHQAPNSQSQINSRASSLEPNSEFLNEEESIELIQPPINEEEEEEEEIECVLLLPRQDSIEKEREGVRVMDIIRKLSNESETATNNNENNDSNGKEIQTTEAPRCFPQVTCSPRIRGRQAYEDLLIQMKRDLNNEVAILLERHCVSKFTHRGRIQSTLRIRCYERCLAIQDRHRSKSTSTGTDINRSPRGSGVMHLRREKYKTNENVETGSSPSSVPSRGKNMDKDPHKDTEKKKKNDLKETHQQVNSVEENAKKAALSESRETKSGLKKPIGELTHKETANGRGKEHDMKEKVVDKEKGDKREVTKEKASTKETAKKAVSSESTEDKNGFKKSVGETPKDGREKKQEMNKKDISKESVEENALIGIAEKVNLWNSEEKMNKKKEIEKDKTESKGNNTIERVEKNEVLEEATRRMINVTSAETSISTTSKETMARCELAEKATRRKKKEDYVSLKSKSKETESKPSSWDKVLQEVIVKTDDTKKPIEKESREERQETEESVKTNTSMGIAEKVSMWNSKDKKSRGRAMDKGKGKIEGKANTEGKAITEVNELLQEASRRLINVETAERSIVTSIEKVDENKDMVVEKRESNRETTRRESSEKGKGKKEEEFASIESKSKYTIEAKTTNSTHEVKPKEESAIHGSQERAKEIHSSQNGEEMSILKNSNEETKIEEREEKVENVKETSSEFLNDWGENEMEEEEEDEYGDYDLYNDDWVNDISRPRSYWEDLRKERYLEVLNAESEKKDICNLIERRTVSNFLTSDLREKIDNLMITRVQSHIRVPINQEAEVEEEEQEWVEECSARNQTEEEDEEESEKTNLEEASECCSQSSARSSNNLLVSWSFRDQDIRNNQEPTTTTSLSLPDQTFVPTNQLTQEMQMISDLRGQMDQLTREVLELRNTVKTCVDMQLHFQKSVTRDLFRSGSSGEQRVETRQDPLKRKCCVCLEMPVDSLLYRCGHMCTCLKCAHELQWSSKKCPICMAPIVDVVRAFLDS